MDVGQTNQERIALGFADIGAVQANGTILGNHAVQVGPQRNAERIVDVEISQRRMFAKEKLEGPLSEMEPYT